MVNDLPQQQFAPLPGDQRKSYACLWGCLAMFGATVVVVVIGAFVAYGIAKKAVNTFTSTAPTALPEVQIDPADYEALQDRIEDFAAAIEGESPTRTLSLTADEINALLQNDPDLAELSGMVHVSIEDDALKGEVSFPLRELGLGNRYVNGSATFSVSVVRGRLMVFIEDLIVKGKPVPEQFMQGLRQENLAKGFASDPNYRAFLERIDDVHIADGKLNILLKQEN